MTSYSWGTIRSFSPRKAVYTPKSFIPHAASRRQTFVHCERFPTAASRRSMDRLSVPLWPNILSDRLPVIALVGFYPANKLIGRRLLSKRRKALIARNHRATTSGIRPAFAGLSRTSRQITNVLLTRLPLACSSQHPLGTPVRLACFRHAASVIPELGSNSQK